MQKIKAKTHKGLRKRVVITASGLLKVRRPCANHYNIKRNKLRKRYAYVSAADMKHCKRLLNI